MGNMNKLRKSTLYKYKEYSNDEIIKMYMDAKNKYYVLSESGKMANQLLIKYGYFCGHEYDDGFKGYDFCFDIQNQLWSLELGLKFRNIEVPVSFELPIITNQDIIDRLKYVCWKDTRWIDKHNYLFDLCDLNNSEFMSDAPVGDELISDKKIRETLEFFEMIIEKEFGDNKKRVLK